LWGETDKGVLGQPLGAGAALEEEAVGKCPPQREEGAERVTVGKFPEGYFEGLTREGGSREAKPDHLARDSSRTITSFSRSFVVANTSYLGHCHRIVKGFAMCLPWVPGYVRPAVRARGVKCEAMERIVVTDVVAEARRALGERLLILAHHYQRDEIVEAADYRGDSLELSRRAAASDARWIVFCGVHFMAETAAVLAKEGQRVLIPREDAGCFLAHSIDYPSLMELWRVLSDVMDPDEEVIPVAYVNTTADVKAFVGEKGGACCTSSSAETVLRWAFSRRPRVLFVPDQYLGRNTARRLGIPEEEIVVWDPRFPDLDRERFARARLILWRGTCNVHVRFLPEDVRRVRRERPEAKVIVHPECRPEVVELADEVGSTSYIIKTVTTSPPGSVWAVGTEERLVSRLAKENPEVEVFSLAEVPPFCSYMSLTRPEDLGAILGGLLSGEERNVVEVPPEIREPARLSLERMLEITSK